MELPPLLRRLSPASTADVRVAYHLGTWKRAPRKFFLGQRMIRLGGFVHQDPLVLSLSGAVGNRRLDLLVVDPTTPPDVARRALLLAGAPDCALGPSEILARAVDEAAEDRPVNAAG